MNNEHSIAELIAKGFDFFYPEDPANMTDKTKFNWKTHEWEVKGKERRHSGYSIPSHCFGFYDWFCKDYSLANKAKRMFTILKGIVKDTKKFDPAKTYVFFKNNCPCFGPLRDDFRVCDIESGKVLYTVTPNDRGFVTVWGHDNDFAEPLFKGSTVREMRKWFAAA